MLVESTTTDIAAKKVSSLLSIRRLQSLPMDGYSPKVGSSSSNQYQYSDLHDDDVVVVAEVVVMVRLSVLLDRSLAILRRFSACGCRSCPMAVEDDDDDGERFDGFSTMIL